MSYRANIQSRSTTRSSASTARRSVSLVDSMVAKVSSSSPMVLTMRQRRRHGLRPHAPCPPRASRVLPQRQGQQHRVQAARQRRVQGVLVSVLPSPPLAGLARPSASWSGAHRGPGFARVPTQYRNAIKCRCPCSPHPICTRATKLVHTRSFPTFLSPPQCFRHPRLTHQQLEEEHHQAPQGGQEAGQEGPRQDH